MPRGATSTTMRTRAGVLPHRNWVSAAVDVEIAAAVVLARERQIVGSRWEFGPRHIRFPREARRGRAGAPGPGHELEDVR